MRFLRYTLGISLLTVACQHKATPVIIDRNAQRPVLGKKAYPPVADIAADTLKGHQLFQAACASCHALPTIVNYNAKAWDGYLYTMLPRTKLNNEEAYHVRAYVLATAGK
jgi:mono/diheme cytochrome c family protein